MSTSRVEESAVIKAPIERVWELISPLDFKFWSLIKNVKFSSTPPSLECGSERYVIFQDGTEQTYSIVEFSTLKKEITYEVTTSSPPVAYTSALHTIKLTRITQDNSTFIQWSSEFSSDAGLQVIEDTKYKRRESLIDLSKCLSK